jgi:hypothetical protein
MHLLQHEDQIKMEKELGATIEILIRRINDDIKSVKNSFESKVDKMQASMVDVRASL